MIVRVKKGQKRNIEEKTMLLEQWKTCVEMANSNAEKRNNANSIFITINTALLAIIPFSLTSKSIILSVVGIIICVLWIRTITSYKKLSKVKYGIISEMENQLPVAPFSMEWVKLKKEENYTNLTKTERVIPWLFIAIFSSSIVIPLAKKTIEFFCECTLNN